MNLFQRLEPFLYSRRNLAGTVLALGGLALYFAGVIGGVLWLPVVAALYLIGVLVVPPEQGLDLRLSAAQDAGQIRSGLDRLLSSIRGRVADDIYAKVVSIRDSILLTLPGERSNVDASDPNVYLIRQTALDYLPTALSTYLAMPRVFAERRAVAAGRTPHDALLEQLDLMDRKMQEAADDIARHDSDRLLANGRFLAERFATSSLDLSSASAEPEAITEAERTTQAEPTTEATRERVH
jgi:hypothetical protein